MIGKSSEWQEEELRLASLQILLEQRRKKPKSGGASARMIAAVLAIESELPLFTKVYNSLVEDSFAEKGERLLMISVRGMDYLLEQLAGDFVRGYPFIAHVLQVLSERDSVTSKELVGDSRNYSIEEIEFALWYLREKGFIESHSLTFSMNESGVEFFRGLSWPLPPPPPPLPFRRRGPDDPNSPVLA